MSFKNSLRSLFALPVVACLLVSGNAEFGFGQTSAATLTGIIQDQTGAVLPDVTVTIANTDRNTSQVTKTNEIGSYVLPALNTGNYSIAADLPGFRKFVQGGIILQVNQVARIDVRLDVGPLEETIHVNGTAPLLAYGGCVCRAVPSG